jgi:hypothetical protein
MWVFWHSRSCERVEPDAFRSAAVCWKDLQIDERVVLPLIDEDRLNKCGVCVWVILVLVCLLELVVDRSLGGTHGDHQL